jgi:hypothetical protein
MVLAFRTAACWLYSLRAGLARPFPTDSDAWFPGCCGAWRAAQQRPEHVKKQPAFVGHLEAADLLGYSTGECAFLVSKKFALKKIKRDRGKVQFDERPFAP